MSAMSSGGVRGVDDAVRFRNVIHDTMVPDLLRIRDAEGLTIAPVPLQIQHYGYEGDQRPKHERNLPLLLEQVRHEPRRVYLWWHLGTVHAGLGQMDQAWAAFEHGLQIVRKDGLKSANDIVAYCEVAFRRALDGRPVDDLVAEGLGLDPGCQALRAAPWWPPGARAAGDGWRSWPTSCCQRLDRAPATAL